MNQQLKKIVLQKEKEVSHLKKASHDLLKLLKDPAKAPLPLSFEKALQKKHLSVIAEIKRRSPSKGLISDIPNPLDLARQYIEGGADALSVLTDETFFGGSLDDLALIAKYAREYHIPVIRKDFIIDEIQLLEALSHGASAVLLIVAILGEETKHFIEKARALNLDALVEVHDEKELEIALRADARIIGINNRNLDTFQIDTDNALKLGGKISKECVKVAESGILDPSLARNYSHSGFNAVLVGEALVRSKDREAFIKACQNDA